MIFNECLFIFPPRLRDTIDSVLVLIHYLLYISHQLDILTQHKDWKQGDIAHVCVMEVTFCIISQLLQLRLCKITRLTNQLTAIGQAALLQLAARMEILITIIPLVCLYCVIYSTLWLRFQAISTAVTTEQCANKHKQDRGCKLANIYANTI